MEYNSIYDVKKAWLEALGGDPSPATNDYEASLLLLDWYLNHSGGTCEHPINIIMDVTKAISAYTGSMDWVYDKSAQKWYVKNSLNEYEEYGIMPTVEALSATTSYPGKLVILSGSSTPHEYEYNNGWNDLGALNVEYYGEFDGNSYFSTGVQAKNNMCVEYEYVVTGVPSSYAAEIFGSRRSSSNYYALSSFHAASKDWVIQNGNNRTTAYTGDYINKEIHTKHWLYTTGSTNNDVKFGLYLTMDGEVKGNVTGTTTGANYTASGNSMEMYVGVMNNNGNVTNYKIRGIIKSAKIYESIDTDGNGELTHNYTFVNDGGVVKMYDEVTETYFVNKGSGSVTLIPAWTPIKDYEEKDAPIKSYSAETYCALYDIPSDIAYVGLYGKVDEDNYIINDEKKWEETQYPTIDYDGLIFKAGEGGGAVAINNFRSNTPAIQISYDGETWENWDYSEIDLGYGQEVALKGTSFVAGSSVSTVKYSTFVFDGQIFARGNLMSLYDNGACTATTAGKFAFYYTFADCSTLENDGLMLPATTLNIYSYNCTFKGCSNMVEAPDLPAKVVPAEGYDGLFSGCTKLEYIYMLANDKSATGALNNWARGLGSTGTFVKATDAWWTTTGVDGVPNGWTIEYCGQTEVSDTTIALASGAVSYTFYVQTDTYEEYDWEITDYPAWCTLSTTAKTGDRTEVVVTPQANNDDPRTGNIVITATDRIITIVVNQEGYSLEFENLYPAYSGADRYWYVQYQQTQQDVNVKLSNQTKAWEITDYPDWITVSPTAGTGNTLISITATPNTANNYREEFITVESGVRQAKLRIMQYQYPIVLSNNLGNRAHSSSDDNEPKSHGNQWFTFDIAVSGEVTTAGYDFVGMKSIVQRSDGSSWHTDPTVYIDTQWNRQKHPTITKFEIDASTIIQMEQAFSTGGGMYPSCTAFTITNCSGITKGLALSGLLSAVSISIGNLPAVSSVGISFPQTTTLTDLTIGSTYANKDVILSGCTNLTVTSLVNVLNALPDNTGTSYNQKCVLGATNLAKLTAEQIAIGTNKGWTVQ